MNKMPVRILIFEDNNGLREGLCQLLALRDDLVIAGDYAEASQVTSLTLLHKPDLILMDIDMPGVDGIEAVRLVRAVNGEVQIIMLTVFDNHTSVFDALKAGANGYLLKRNVSDRLVPAIYEVLEGGAPMSPSIARMVIDEMQLRKKPDAYSLSERERQILSLLANGNSFKMIASDLGISLETVRTHIKHIYEKLHVNSQIEAVSKAIREKLV
jgi:DNA-binding NarL/FixJ family response regulator